MASFLSKFIGGAAKQGGILLADMASQNIRADLQAKRDQVLNENRAATETSRREFEVAQTESSREFQTERDTANREFQIEREKAKAKESGSGHSPQVLSLIGKTFNSLLVQEEKSLKPEKERQTPEELYAQATEMVTGKTRGPGTPEPVQVPKPVPKPEPEPEPFYKEFKKREDIERPPVKPWKGRPGRVQKKFDSAEKVPASDIRPGEQTATNANGEKVVMRGGKWIPVIQ